MISDEPSDPIGRCPSVEVKITKVVNKRIRILPSLVGVSFFFLLPSSPSLSFGGEWNHHKKVQCPFMCIRENNNLWMKLWQNVLSDCVKHRA